jgi:hypothetical protein
VLRVAQGRLSLRLTNGFARDDAIEEDEDVVRIQTDTLPARLAF